MIFCQGEMGRFFLFLYGKRPFLNVRGPRSIFLLFFFYKKNQKRVARGDLEKFGHAFSKFVKLSRCVGIKQLQISRSFCENFLLNFLNATKEGLFGGLDLEKTFRGKNTVTTNFPDLIRELYPTYGTLLAQKDIMGWQGVGRMFGSKGGGQVSMQDFLEFSRGGYQWKI